MTERRTKAPTNEGRALRFIREAKGWTGPFDPVDFQRVHEEDIALLVGVFEMIRQDERYRLRRLLSEKANAVYNRQAQDFPSNVLDAVSLWLSDTTAPLVLRTETAADSG